MNYELVYNNKPILINIKLNTFKQILPHFSWSNADYLSRRKTFMYTMYKSVFNKYEWLNEQNLILKFKNAIKYNSK